MANSSEIKNSRIREGMAGKNASLHGDPKLTATFTAEVLDAQRDNLFKSSVQDMPGLNTETASAELVSIAETVRRGESISSFNDPLEDEIRIPVNPYYLRSLGKRRASRKRKPQSAAS